MFYLLFLDSWQHNAHVCKFSLEQEAMVNVARVITHQILESRQLLPPDMPDFTTEAGKQKLQGKRHFE